MEVISLSDIRDQKNNQMLSDACSSAVNQVQMIREACKRGGYPGGDPVSALFMAAYLYALHPDSFSR